MHQDIIHSYERRVARTRRRSVLRKIVGTLACLVIFCTTYVLILPAITMEQKTFCGLEEHTHTDACYKQTSNRNLICTADQLTVHSHTDACYAEGGTLICGQADYLAHTHNEQCFDTNGELVCTLNERSAHQHTDDCYTPGETQEVVLHVHSEACNGLERGELICEEIERSGHSHNESCYVVTNELSCTIPEGHVHGDGCYTFPLICTEIDETHVHDDICYDSTPILICCIEQENHIHETACYQKDLICTLVEDPGHSHSDECYAWNNVIICGKEEGEAEPTEAPETILICTEPIAVTHVHGDECFEIITSEQENICNNIEEGHVHSDTCYERICGLEEHVHSIACYSDPEADLETEKDWKATFAHVNLTGIWEQDVISIAQTQLGYTESTRNYVVSEDNSIYGYTRYGDWYGIPYGDWCAMYASFCLKYAGVENMPLDSVVRSWVESLTVLQLYHKAEVYEPKPGNLIFFDWDHNGLSDHVGLVVELIPAEGDKSAQVKTIEGNNGNSVKYFYYDIDDSDIIGYSELPDNTAYYDCGTARHVHNEYCSDIDGNLYCQKQEHVHSAECIVVEEEPTDLAVEEGAPYVITRTAETENYIVTVSYSSELYMPEDAELRVLEYAKDSEIFLRRSEEAGGELAWLLNIGFFAGEEEVELSGDFAVVVTSKQGNVVDSSIHHFTDAGIEKLEGESVTDGLDEGQSAIAFSSGSFSDFGGFSGSSKAATDTLYTLDVLGAGETLKAGNQYYIYVKGGRDDRHYFLSEQPASCGPLTNSGPEGGTGITTTFTYSPWNDSTWYMYESHIKTESNNSRFLWTAEAGSTNDTFRLKNSNGRYLDITYYGFTTSTNPVNITVNSRNVAKKLSVPTGYSYPRNYTLSINRSEDIYIAQVTSSGSSSGGAIPEKNYPEAVHTGNVEVNVVNFYNIVDDAGTVSSLAGCRFNVIDQNKEIVASVVSGSDTSVSLSGLSPGRYTLEQVYVPDGYFGDPDPERTFTIDSSGEVNFGEDGSIFVNRPVAVISSDKTAVVEDYEKRIYEITMEASSQMKAYDLEPIEVLFVIDQSNSMLFPSSLNDTGKKFTINSSGTGNVARLDALNLDKSQVYYFISDPNGSSTVWALWHNGETWLYQDASYYSKAWHNLHADSSNNYEGYYEQLGSNIVFPKTGAAYGTTDVSEGKTNGGDIAVGVGGSLKTYVDQNSPEFTIYTAGGQYNRLHYLELAVASAITQLEAIDERNYVGLIKFTKKVNDADCVVPARFNSNPNHLNNLIGKVNRINTDGGTRQDRALQEAIDYQNVYYENAKDKYTILITDGAPSVDSGDNIDQVYRDIVSNAATLTKNSKLISLALSMKDVYRGSQTLEDISTDGFYPCEDAELLLNKLSEIMFQAILSSKQDITPEAHIVDTISDSFYPVAWSYSPVKDRQLLYTEADGRNWYVLKPDDRIGLDGSYYTGQPNNTGAYGVLKNTHKHTEHCYYYWQGSDNQIHQEYVCTIQNGDYYIQWDQQALPTNPGWKGIVYVKAKEDFIGGNAIETNKQAHIAIGISRKEYETPTVNVRLLEMNENSSEVTVYLGDMINDGQSGQFSTPLATLQDFFDKIYFTKINVEEAAYTDNGILMNKIAPDATADDGLEGDRFYLKYAISQLTLAQWGALTDMNDEGKSRNPITVAYTYDDPSSHGPVGYFTISLEKIGEDSDYLTHRAQHDCHSGHSEGNSCENPAEEYMLKVVYTAYKLSEEGRPQNTVHNGSGSPGTEVGGQKAGSTVETGLGVVESENIHEVHVISGSLKVTKTLKEDLANTLKAQGKTVAEFTFTLEMTDTNSVGSIVAGSTAGSYSFQYGDAGATSFAITVPLTLAEGQTTYTASATVTDLPRGTYTLTENPGDDFNMDSLTVDVKATNCTYGKDDTTSAVFYMGYCTTEKENVIGKAEATDVYTSYLRSPNGVRGEAVVVNDTNSVDAEVPVQKVWSDGNTQHTSDAVYVVLYKTVVNGETSTPELVITEVDGDYVAKILKLDSDNNWTSKFKVPLISGEDDVSNYGYHVHEVKLVDGNTEGAVQAILENDGTTVYFTELENDLIAFGDTHYMVTYSEAEDTLVVTNHVARTLPKSGGPGTYLYTIGGLTMMSIALIYGFILNRKHRREAGV